MKSLGLVIFLVANVTAYMHKVPQQLANRAAVLEARSGCDANNCARAVTGTRPGKVPDITSRQADCSSFMEATVYTNYFGTTVTTVTPTAVPTYASACSTPGSPQQAYSSACSCWSITATTTTTANYACATPNTFYSCADGYNDVCWCTQDESGKNYCSTTFEGDFIVGCPCTPPYICTSDGVCNLAGVSSDCSGPQIEP
jgi:hypothetical protein